MRIGLIRTRYTPYGGAEVFLERFISALVKKGHSAEVFASSWPEDPSIVFHRVPVRGPSFLRPLVFARNVAKAVEAARPDVVISLERTYCQDIYRAGDGCHREWLERKGRAAGMLKRLSIPMNPLHTVLLHLEKRLFTDPRLKMVVANSMGVKRDIIRHYGLPEEKICVIYNGIDAGRISSVSPLEKARLRVELGIEAEGVALLFVGSGFERKGLRYLIRAMGLLKDTDVRLVVVGKGRTSDYEREARRAGVMERVSFKGPVKGALKYYQASDIFVLPTIYEPFSNACLEAMAAGLPVVTTAVNGASEVIRDGVSGAVLDDPTDAASLAGRIREFLDADKRAKAGLRARKTAEVLTIDKNVDAFIKLIDDIARKDKRRI